MGRKANSENVTTEPQSRLERLWRLLSQGIDWNTAVAIVKTEAKAQDVGTAPPSRFASTEKGDRHE